MFGVKNKKKKAKKEKQPAVSSLLWQKVHVIPSQFYQPPKQSKMKPIILIVLALVLIGGLTAGTVLIISNIPEKSSVPPPVKVNQPQPTNTNLNQTTNINQKPKINTNINKSANTNLNTNLNKNTNINVSLPPPPPPAPDVDDDGLTEAEEILYQTNVNKPDTDGDGYLDGQEVLNGYDPAQAKITLLESGKFKIYFNKFFHYQVQYPAQWLIREADNSRRRVIFNTLQGEFIEIKVEDNPKQLDLLDWYLNQFPSLQTKQVKEIKIDGLRAIVHINQLSYYLIDPNDLSKIYLIRYHRGTKPRIDFASTFKSIIFSFKLSF